MTQTNHLTLWDSVSKTDPTHTRHVSQRGGYTAIDPTYQLKEATKRFGPYGQGFGLRHIRYSFELKDVGLVILHAEFFYPSGSFEISNAASFTLGKSGVPDADFAKKLETNTLSKALSKLGFNADVFLGQFDDVHYVEFRQQEVQADQAINRAEAAEKQAKAFADEMRDLLAQIEQATTTGELKGLYTVAMKKAQFKQAQDWQITLTQAKDKTKSQIEAQQAA